MVSYKFDLNDPVIRSFIFYGSILVGKMLLMSVLTARWRFQKKVFASPEDTKFGKKARVAYNDEDIERVRRAHRNDIENIPLFFISSFLYILTNPTPWIAINIFRVYTVCRIIHTYVYAIQVIPQPVRAITFGIAYGLNWYMVVNTIISYL